MESDGVRLALIEASLNAASRARRDAAALLLNALRSEAGMNLPQDFSTQLSGEAPAAVIAEVRALIAELGLGRGSPERD